MLKSAVLILFFQVFVVRAQEFIPHGELLLPEHIKYILSKKIESEKSGFYSTGKDGIPSGKPLSKTVARYSLKGQPFAVTVTDSTGTSVDSFYYDKAGSVERIVNFRGKSDTNTAPVSRYYFTRDSTGKTLEVSLFDISTAAITTTWRYFYTKTGKLTSIIRVSISDSTAADSLLWQFDKNEKLTTRLEGDKRSEYKYDQAGNISVINEFSGKTPGNTIKYTYDSNKRLIKSTITGKNFNSVSEYLYNKNGILILTKTKTDRGVKGSETYFTGIREVEVFK